MTKEEKIKEVMELVERFEMSVDEAARLCSKDQDYEAEREYAESRDVLQVIESKLRELIN